MGCGHFAAVFIIGETFHLGAKRLLRPTKNVTCANERTVRGTAPGTLCANVSTALTFVIQNKQEPLWRDVLVD